MSYDLRIWRLIFQACLRILQSAFDCHINIWSSKKKNKKKRLMNSSPSLMSCNWKDTIAVSKTFACRFRCFEKWQMPSMTKCHFVFEWDDSSTSSLVLPLIHVETNLKKRINSEKWHATTLFLRLTPWWGKTSMLEFVGMAMTLRLKNVGKWPKDCQD